MMCNEEEQGTKRHSYLCPQKLHFLQGLGSEVTGLDGQRGPTQVGCAGGKTTRAACFPAKKL